MLHQKNILCTKKLIFYITAHHKVKLISNSTESRYKTQKAQRQKKLVFQTNPQKMQTCINRKMLKSNADPDVLYFQKSLSSERNSLRFRRDLFPFSYLRRLQNNYASDSLKVCYQTLILTECCIIVKKKNFSCVIVRRKNLYFLVTMIVFDIIKFS